MGQKINSVASISSLQQQAKIEQLLGEIGLLSNARPYLCIVISVFMVLTSCLQSSCSLCCGPATRGCLSSMSLPSVVQMQLSDFRFQPHGTVQPCREVPPPPPPPGRAGRALVLLSFRPIDSSAITPSVVQIEQPHHAVISCGKPAHGSGSLQLSHSISGVLMSL